MNPVAMMAGMAVGSAIGQNIAGNINNVMQPSVQQPSTSPPDPAVAYNVAVNGQATGPFGLATLQKMIVSGQLIKDSLVWKSGMPSWAKAGDVDEIKSLFPEIPPIPTDNSGMPPIPHT